MADKLEQIGIDLIDDPKVPMRTAMNEEKIDELVRSIKRHGLMSPLTLVKIGDRYEVVAGHRRLVACKRADMALIPAIVRELKEGEIDELRIAENAFREDINPVEWARYIKQIIERTGEEPEQLQERTGKSKEFLIARFEILAYPPYMIDALEKELIGITAAQWLMRISDERVRAEYVTFAVSGGITAKRAEAWFRSWEAGNLPRDASTYIVPESSMTTEPIPIFDMCAICRTREDITKMRMHYGHESCVQEIARAIAAGD